MRTPGPRHDAALDGVRAVAALTVVGYHAWLYTLPTVTARHRATLGDMIAHELRLGLVLFFVLSGFLLYTPWVRAARERLAAPRVGPYALRRAARIVPAYWLALAGSIVLLWPHGATPGVRLPDASDLWLFAVFGQNLTPGTLLKLDPPMWTLAVEVSFYALLPLLGWLALRGGRRIGPVAVPLAFLAGGLLYNRAIAFDGSLPLTVTKLLPAVAPYFALGMLAAVAAHRRALGPRAVWLLLGAGAALVAADGVWAAIGAQTGSHDPALRIWRDTPAAAGFALVIGAVACARAPLRALAARPVAWLGQVSYGVYLWHVPLMLFLRAHGLLPSDAALGFAVAIGPTLVVAAASWHWLERPLQERARRAVKRRAPAPHPSAGRADVARA